ncbi:MAG: aminoglycoside phosphotransferase family protein [Actinobacteria bacterium]|nr:aminoglycoside phosphotransferase family protein [Actinomycetota bacterium]
MTLPQRPLAGPAPHVATSAGSPAAGKGQSLQWDVLYPRVHGSWSAILSHGGKERAYGLYDPIDKTLQEVAPAQDLVLPTLGRWLTRGELVSYRVGRRAVVRTVAGDATAYAKLVAPKRAARLVARHEDLSALSAADPGFPGVPAVVGAGVDDAILLADARGTSLHDHLARRLPCDSPVLVHLARALVRFHGTPAFTLDVPSATGPALGQWASLVAAQFPAWRKRYGEVLQAVEGAEPGAPRYVDRLVHGDLHDKNVILRGHRVVLLDVDALRRGDPAEDIGNLAAHFVLRALQRGDPAEGGRSQAARFTAVYRRAAGDVDPAAVVAAGARSLFRLACLYCFRRRWQPIVPALLAEAVAWSTGPETLGGNTSPL